MKKTTLSLSLLIFGSQFGSGLHAEESIDNLFTMSLSELARVEITGSTLTPKRVSTAPSSVTVFTHEQIKRMGFDSLDELVNIVPGFQSFRGTRSSISINSSIRGRRVGNANAEILLLVDGVRLNDPRGSGSFFATPKMPLMQIERVEFIRGPGSAIYGSNAMLGVINIITRSNVREVGAAVGSFSRTQAYVMASHKKGDFSVDAFAYYDKDDGDDFQLQDTFGPGQVETDDPRKQANFNIKLKWRETQLNIQHYQTQGNNFYELNNISNGVNKREVEISTVSLKQGFDWLSVDSFVQLNYTDARFATNAQFTSAAAATLLSGGAGTEPFFGDAELDDYTETRVKWHNDWKINDGSSLQFGAEYRYIDAPETVANSNYDLGDLANGDFPIRYYERSTGNTSVQAASIRDIFGLYAQYQQQILDRTQMTLGLRYDDFSGIGSEFSPRIGLVQTLNQHHSLKLLYGEAFRAPTESELNLLNNPVLLGNPDLKPETVQTWDLIWLGQWSQTSLSLGYFENRFKNSIVEVDTNGTGRFENIDQDPTKGVEFEISHALTKGLLLRGSYTNLLETSDSSSAQAEQFGSIMVNYQRSRWNFNLIATYFDERKTLVSNNNNVPLTLDDYWQIYGKVSYDVSDSLQTYAQAKNLLDEDYQTPNNSQSLTVGTANRGRELSVGFVWKY